MLIEHLPKKALDFYFFDHFITFQPHPSRSTNTDTSTFLHRLSKDGGNIPDNFWVKSSEE